MILRVALSTGMRFATSRGLVTTEDLFHMPLTAKDGFSLNDTAKNISGSLKALGEESFVEQTDSIQRGLLSDALDVVKLVIEHKQAINKAAVEKRERREKRQKLLTALENRENEELLSMSKEDILKQLEELD